MTTTPTAVEGAVAGLRHVQSQRSTHSAGSEMGAVVSVFDAMSRKCPSQGPVLNEWPTNVHAQQHMVVATRNVFGMDWRYGIDCQTSNHASLEVSAEQSVRLRDPSVIVVPTLASHQSLQDALDTFFATGSGSDLAFGNAASPCPYCAESLHENLCQWRVLPWRADNAPDRFFLVGSGTGATVVSLDLCLGVNYSLVAVAYHMDR